MLTRLIYLTVVFAVCHDYRFCRMFKTSVMVPFKKKCKLVKSGNSEMARESEGESKKLEGSRGICPENSQQQLLMQRLFLLSYSLPQFFLKTSENVFHLD